VFAGLGSLNHLCAVLGVRRAQNHAFDARVGQGVRPGGLIMVHGLPNDPRWPPEHYAGQDWTDGCIALNNADMMEFWMLVQSGTPIHINP
jgi:murein L,D-transpeptidase YafK